MHQRTQRERLNINIPVHLPDTAELLGHVVDISLTGLSISGRGEMPEQAIGQLELSLPWTIDGLDTVSLRVEPRWHEHTRDGHWHAGFRILACPDAHLVALEQLAQRFGQSH